MRRTTPPLVEYEGDDPLAAVTAANLNRRHLNESQRAMIAARLAVLPSHRPDKESRPIGLLSQPDAAKRFNVSSRNVKRARVLLEQAAPELVKAVDQGRVTVSAASELARLPAVHAAIAPAGEGK